MSDGPAILDSVSGCVVIIQFQGWQSEKASVDALHRFNRTNPDSVISDTNLASPEMRVLEVRTGELADSLVKYCEAHGLAAYRPY